jgi:hypothetical protein
MGITCDYVSGCSCVAGYNVSATNIGACEPCDANACSLDSPNSCSAVCDATAAYACPSGGACACAEEYYTPVGSTDQNVCVTCDGSGVGAQQFTGLASTVVQCSLNTAITPSTCRSYCHTHHPAYLCPGGAACECAPYYKPAGDACVQSPSGLEEVGWGLKGGGYKLIGPREYLYHPSANTVFGASQALSA